MDEAAIIWEYRQMCHLEAEQNGDKSTDSQQYQDDGYTQELESLGVTQDMLQQMRGKP